MAAQRLEAAIEELYGLDPEDFTAARTRLATEAKAAGDQADAKAITALRRPTRSAALVNRLVRADPSVAADLSRLGTDLAQAQRALDGTRLRELSGRRRRLIEDLTRRALHTGGAAPAASVRNEVGATLEAALADPAVADRLAEGTLLKAATWAGFGTPPPDLQIVPTPATAKTAAQSKLAPAHRRDAAAQKRATAAEKRAEQRAAAERAESERARQEAIERAEAEVLEAQRAVEQTRAAQAVAKEDLRRAEAEVTQARRRVDAAASEVRAAATQQARAAQAARAARR
ncbi:MAG: hypothetical protein ABJA87_07300 [bacterium]